MKMITKEKKSNMSKELVRKYEVLQAKLRQVSNYHIESDKKSTSITPGTSNTVIVSWKKTRMKELTQELVELEALMEKNKNGNDN